MKVLVIGGGGREHAIVHTLKKSPKVDHIWCAPGNGGIAAEAECVAIKATDIDGMVAFAKEFLRTPQTRSSTSRRTVRRLLSRRMVLHSARALPLL